MPPPPLSAWTHTYPQDMYTEWLKFRAINSSSLAPLNFLLLFLAKLAPEYLGTNKTRLSGMQIASNRTPRHAGWLEENKVQFCIYFASGLALVEFILILFCFVFVCRFLLSDIDWFLVWFLLISFFFFNGQRIIHKQRADFRLYFSIFYL